MSKTVIQQLIEYFSYYQASNWSSDELVKKFQSLLPEEKKQMEDAYNKGKDDLLTDLAKATK